MAQILTLSRIVDNSKELGVVQKEEKLFKATAAEAVYHSNGRIQNKTSSWSKELPLAVIYENERTDEGQSNDKQETKAETSCKFYLSDNEGEYASPDQESKEASLTSSKFKKVYQLDNEKSTTQRGRKSFADLVTEVMSESVKRDSHPFGDRSIYDVSLGGEQTKLHSEEGTLFIWVLATIIILGVAVGVILMSQMHQAKQFNRGSSNEISSIVNATEY